MTVEFIHIHPVGERCPDQLFFRVADDPDIDAVIGFGDVILEIGDDGYTVIDDYKEETEIWLLKILK